MTTRPSLQALRRMLEHALATEDRDDADGVRHCRATGRVMADEATHVDGTPCIDGIPRIVQIIPATAGWRVSGRNDAGPWQEPIACWALLEACDGFRWVAPVYRNLGEANFGFLEPEEAGAKTTLLPPEEEAQG
jgi:hypothetical protein